MANARRVTKPKLVHQFLIILLDTEPLIWRRIEVPMDYSFWDLHVAIQDAMGWLDYHLHEFQVVNPSTNHVEHFGIPNDSGDFEYDLLPSWDFNIQDYFTRRDLSVARYVYDMGDDWQHVVAYEGLGNQKSGVKYPRCTGGQKRCPPEDCGGIPGFERFLHIISDKDDPEHEDMLAWVGGEYDPDDFDPAAVKFANPTKRWKKAFT